MVSTVLAQNYRVLTNDTGSNFVRGVIAAAISSARWNGALPYDVGVFELDEAWAVRFVQQVPPRRAVLLNVMRDQLDRFGEIDTTAQLLGKVAAATTGSLVLNRDDVRICALTDSAQASVTWFGVSAGASASFPNDEELYGGPISVATQHADVELTALASQGDAAVRLRIGTEQESVALRAQGPHNAQNAAAAAALALTFGLGAPQIAAALESVEPAFGPGPDLCGERPPGDVEPREEPSGFSAKPART